MVDIPVQEGMNSFSSLLIVSVSMSILESNGQPCLFVFVCLFWKKKNLYTFWVFAVLDSVCSLVYILLRARLGLEQITLYLSSIIHA